MTFDPERRRRVMGRSIKLGHCICNPKEPCPCPLFEDKNVCLCAGERLEEDPGDEIRERDRRHPIPDVLQPAENVEAKEPRDDEHDDDPGRPDEELQEARAA